MPTSIESPARARKPIAIYTAKSDEQSLPNIASIIHDHAASTPDDIVFLIPDQARTDWLPVTWQFYSDFLAELTLTWSAKFAQQMNSTPSSSGVAGSAAQMKAPVAGVLISPAEDFFGPFFALSSIGFTAMPINPYLSAETIAEICDRAAVSVLVCGGTVASAGHCVSGLRPSICLHELTRQEYMSMRTFGEAGNIIDGSDRRERLDQIKYVMKHKVVSDPAYLLHSTGSTSTPKVIPWHNKAIFAQIRRNVILEGFMNPTRRGRMGLASDEDGDAALPTFTSKAPGWIVFVNKEPFAIAPIGIVLKIMFLGSGWPIALPLFKSIECTPTALLGNLTRVGTQEYSIYSADLTAIVNYLHGPTQTPEEEERKCVWLSHLRSLGPLPCGGSRVERSTMAKAIKLGIQVQVTLGTTEAGFFMASRPACIAKEWGNNDEPSDEILDLALGMKAFPDVPVFFEPVDSEHTPAYGQTEPEQLYELVLDAEDIAVSSQAIANDGHKWRTRDLFRKIVHVDANGQIDELFVYEMRKDELLMLGNGEIISPLSIDAELRAIAIRTCGFGNIEVLLCGTSRPLPCILIEGVHEAADQLRVTQSIEQAMPIINSALPAFFPLSVTRLAFLPCGVRFTRTIKDVISRAKTELDLTHVIDTLYVRH
ncbi:uncharacterized protein L969DRAFT_85982 [Mixia osmundae IAM 14324]|uniref:uncharacterized protein n=1 Tax=Mixia osmundae (strain CBS 9802 / IAM 14324 / JCM 22182 / KY 12970) TaxID=764103 RepID=UPI0004A5529C|nr:uncharacterized protein L969DRAFT_85982 [Mixia osmundae IAM 14324]KEI40759.1 hypothetical protein L969DRAFT_85982 [Mixia osmundae IAM 14324]